MCETKRTNLTNAYGKGKKIEKKQKQLSVQKPKRKQQTPTCLPLLVQ